MLDLQPEEPTIYWTYGQCGEYKEQGYPDEVWVTDLIGTPIVKQDSIKFDAPESWDYGSGWTLVFRREPTGYWTAEFDGTWEAFLGETETHKMLTGIWRWREGSMAGGFVALFPKEQGI
jgi:hypothetical protein